jgi:DNA topoisomerase-1
MSIAQKLFEKGLITYHRTDSFNLSPKFLEEAREYISSEIGKEYLPDHPNFYKSNKKSAQEAHEAIRPTSLNLKIKGLTDEEYKIYSLIFKRAIESQMLPMEYLQTTYKIISDNGYVFRATGSIVTFEGWGAFGKRLNLVEEEEGSSVLPSLSEGDVLNMFDLETKQHFTQPPARYSDATLVKALEDFEIGRPSTYAPTISTIQERGYVKKEGKYFYPDEVAFVVTDLLVKHFPEVIDYQFTAQMENKFDMIAEGEAEWVPIIKDFYEPFEAHVKEKDQELQKADFTFMGYSEEICPKCGSKMMFKLGKFGKFLSCSNYPVCEFAKPVDSEGFDEKGDQIEFEICEKCGGGMVLKMGRFGKFLACKNFPKCKNIKKYVQKVGVKCPICSEGDLIVKKFRSSTFYGCSKYPDCKFRTSKNPLETPTEVLVASYEKNETFEKEGNIQTKAIGKEGFLKSKDKKSTKPRKKSLRVKRKPA